MTVAALPCLAVRVNGAELTPELAGAMAGIRVQQRLSLPAVAELTFVDLPATAGSWAVQPGAAIEVSLSEAGPALLSGDVTEVIAIWGPAGQRNVRVRAYDRLHRLRKHQSVKAWVDVDLKRAVTELADAAGLTVDADGVDVHWPRVVQRGQSDLEFVAELGRRAGLYLMVSERTLRLVTMEGGGEPVPLSLGSTMLEARAQVSGEPACRSVEVAGWDPLEVEGHRGRASSARSGRTAAAAAPPGRFSLDGVRQLLAGVTIDDRQAEQLAQAELDRRVAGEVTLWGVAEGNARLQPGARVDVEGLGDEWDGRYVLTSVDHTVERDTGYVSEITCGPPPPAAARGLPTLTLGMVTDVADPHDLGRVRVKLPALFDVDTEWLAVLVPGAGVDKGLVALPDVGDQVLVAFPDWDGAAGIVLGGLYGVVGPPDTGVVDSARQRFTMTTPGGQLVRLDDNRSLVLLQDRTGNRVEMSPDLVVVHAKVDLHLEAPGRAIVMTADTIDMRRG